jgi:hypothetical protein
MPISRHAKEKLQQLHGEVVRTLQMMHLAAFPLSRENAHKAFIAAENKFQQALEAAMHGGNGLLEDADAKKLEARLDLESRMKKRSTGLGSLPMKVREARGRARPRKDLTPD